MSQTPRQYVDRLKGIMNEFVRTAAEAAVSVVPPEQREQVASAVEATANKAREQAASVIGEVGAALNRLSANVKPDRPAPRRSAHRPAAKKASRNKTGKKISTKKGKKKPRR